MRSWLPWLTGIVASAALAPAQATEPVAIEFVAEVNGAPFSCRAKYASVGARKVEWQPADFRLYVSQFALGGPHGESTPLTLVSDGVWQQDDVALLDFEDQTGGCKNGTKETNVHVHGTTQAPLDKARGLTFEIAVPFERNHSDATAAMPPLDQAGLFWSWQGGYKFLSLDGRVEGRAGHSVHIGSTGCEMQTPSRVRSCARPNHVVVTLPHFMPGRDQVVLDIGHLLSTSDLAATAHASANGCMAEPDNAACAPLWDKLGLTGKPQGFVTVRRKAKPPAQH